MAVSENFSIPIPDGYRVFFREMEVAGISFRRKQAINAFSGKQVIIISLEKEPSNKHDKNAIKIIVTKKGLFRSKKLHIGYVPREVAEVISKIEVTGKLLPRLTNAWVGDEGGVSVRFDILGPKSEYSVIKNI